MINLLLSGLKKMNNSYSKPQIWVNYQLKLSQSSSKRKKIYSNKFKLIFLYSWLDLNVFIQSFKHFSILYKFTTLREKRLQATKTTKKTRQQHSSTKLLRKNKVNCLGNNNSNNNKRNKKKLSNREK